MDKKYIVWGVVAAIVVIMAVIFISGQDKETTTNKNLVIPKVGDKSPGEGVGVPGKIAEGESDKPSQQYWVFETELKEGKLNPFEFRLPIGDLLGISIKNSEDKEHIVQISGKSEFVPNFIKRTIAPGKEASFTTQVLEAGEFDIICPTCKNQVIGKFVVVPK